MAEEEPKPVVKTVAERMDYSGRPFGYMMPDSYTVMLRAMTVCEKHHGEEGMATCQLRTKLGALLSRCGWEVSLSAIFDTFSRFPTHSAYR